MLPNMHVWDEIMNKNISRELVILPTPIPWNQYFKCYISV